MFLRDTTLLNVQASDGRRVEVVASGLPVAQGVPVAVDATVVSPVRADGRALPKASWLKGSTFSKAERLKQQTYPELVGSSVLALKTVAAEVGGRWSKQAVKLVEEVASARARTEVSSFRRGAYRAWRQRWLTMLSVSLQHSLASTLVSDGASFGRSQPTDGHTPLAVDVWVSARGGGGCGAEVVLSRDE